MAGKYEDAKKTPAKISISGAELLLEIQAPRA